MSRKSAAMLGGFLLISLTALAADVIGNKGLSTNKMDESELRMVFTGAVDKLPRTGDKVVIITYPKDSPEHRAFLYEIGIQSYEYDSKLKRNIYLGRTKGPKIVKSQQQMLDEVAKTPGGIGYAEQSVGSNSDVMHIDILR